MIRRLLGGRDRNGEGETHRPPAPFVVGVRRSGTTLLRLMLDAHPQLAIPSETHFVPDLIEASGKDDASPESLAGMLISHPRWGDFHLDAGELRGRFQKLERINSGAVLRAFYVLYAEQESKPRWGDKTPGYVRHMRKIEEALPEARFVHLIRDGRDGALSILSQDMRLEGIAKAAKSWKNLIEGSRAQAESLNHYLEVRYEDLILDTEPTLRRVCEFCELPWDPAVLDYHERAGERLQEMARDLPRPGRPPRTSGQRLSSHALTREPPKADRVGQWRTQMSEADRTTFEGIAGNLLAELGYEVGTDGSRAFGRG